MPLDNKQQGLITYSERVRIERANGLRNDETCIREHFCSPYDDEFYKGKTYGDVAQTPIRRNAVCTHTKVIVPVKPAVLVQDTVQVINAHTNPAGYRVVDRNPCDGRTGMLNVITEGTPINHASTVEVYTDTIKDTIYSEPMKVKTVKVQVENEEAVEQPLAVGGTEDTTITTDNGLNVTE